MSGEFFSQKGKGKKRDAHLHEPILAMGTDDDTGIRAAKDAGLTADEIDELYWPRSMVKKKEG